MYEGCVFFMTENRDISVDIPKHESKAVLRVNYIAWGVQIAIISCKIYLRLRQKKTRARKLFSFLRTTSHSDGGLKRKHLISMSGSSSRNKVLTLILACTYLAYQSELWYMLRDGSRPNTHLKTEKFTKTGIFKINQNVNTMSQEKYLSTLDNFLSVLTQKN